MFSASTTRNTDRTRCLVEQAFEIHKIADNVERELNFMSRLCLASTSTVFRRFALRSHISYLRVMLCHLGICDPQGFLEMLNLCNGVVTGSTALSLVLRPCEWSPNDRNLVAPRERGAEVEAFLLHDGFITHGVDNSQTIRSHLIQFVARHRTYTRSDQPRTSVTITESFEDSVFPVILASSSTADMLCVSIAGVFSVLPDLLVAQINMRGFPTSPIEEDLGRRFHGKQFIVLNDTSDLPGECGIHCPLLWRSAADGTSTMMINWSLSQLHGHDGMLSQLLAHRYWWQLSRQCHNQRCMIRRHNLGLTKTATTSEDQIMTVRQDIANHPLNKDVEWWMLSGFVPLHVGIDVLRSSDDLFMSLWINEFGLDAPMIDPTSQQTCIHAHPLSGEELPFTLVVCIQYWLHHQTNYLLMSLADRLGGSEHEWDYQGNIVVIKESCTEHGGVLDVNASDLDLISEVLIRAAQCHIIPCAMIKQNGSTHDLRK
ncbi:hypothetical protein C8R48DRAFT_781075 [Suillus tomentosus]|nr:hypothetical protein C8R48DRAFT_781075 [Suillus tomentosus]